MSINGESCYSLKGGVYEEFAADGAPADEDWVIIFGAIGKGEENADGSVVDF